MTFSILQVRSFYLILKKIYLIFELIERNNTRLESLLLGRFHTHLMDVYAPMVIRYIGN